MGLGTISLSALPGMHGGREVARGVEAWGGGVGWRSSWGGVARGVARGVA